MQIITNRIRIFLFGISVAVMALASPHHALRIAHDVLDKASGSK
jgi:hypothetical protein